MRLWYINIHETGAIESAGHKVLVLPTTTVNHSRTVENEYLKHWATKPLSIWFSGIVYIKSDGERNNL